MDYHTTSIIGINFYKHNQLITIDKSLKCAIWHYDPTSSQPPLSPGYTFEFSSSFLIYKESSNPKFTNIFPGGALGKEGPEQLYKKWMLGEGFLRKMIFNNPQKQYAYFRSNDEMEIEGELPVWRFSYDDSNQKVLKIT